MREFFKRALQLYRVPLTPEGEELLRVHRNETRELVHASVNETALFIIIGKAIMNFKIDFKFLL